MALVTTADGIEESHRAKKLASLVGIEGGHAIGTSLSVLRMFYQLGARYLTLTHTCNTPWADCCKVDEPGRVPHIGGLSHFGTVSQPDIAFSHSKLIGRLPFPAGCTGNESFGHDCRSITCLRSHNAGCAGHIQGTGNLLPLIGTCDLQQFTECTRPCPQAYCKYKSVIVIQIYSN